MRYLISSWLCRLVSTPLLRGIFRYNNNSSMFNMYILNEIFTNGLSHFFLYIPSILSVLCGISVIIVKNPIVSVLFLIGLFSSIAGYLMMLGISFIGLSYLLVYVGAVSILFLFILMMINVRVSELITDNTNSIPLAIMIGVFFYITLNNLLLSFNLDYNINEKVYSMTRDKTHNYINSAFTGGEEGILTNFYSFSFENDVEKYKTNLSFVTSHI